MKKMNISMDFMKPLGGAFKKYKALVPSVVILIVAMLLFFPLLWLGGKVKAQMKTSSGYASNVQSLLKSTPPREKVQQLTSFMDKLEKESESVHRMAVQSTSRDLMTYDYVIFPEPKDPSSQVYNEFGHRYRAAIESLVRKMNALDAPSEAEIKAKTGASLKTGLGGYGAAKVSVASDPMVDALCQTRAQEISVYANPQVFSWYKFWADYKFTGKDQALQDCWDSQIALWIYEDVADTVIKINGTSAQVPAAPVKRVLGVRFAGPVIVRGGKKQMFYGEMGGLGRGMMGMSGSQVRDMPNYVTAMLPSNFVPLSPTGRVSNDDVDIVHFALSVVLDNRFVLTFMKELCSEKPHSFYPKYDSSKEKVQSCHNQISILQSNISVINPMQSEHELYRYGQGASMRVDLVCEYLFVREGYDMVKPDLIKERLGQSSAEETTATPGVPGGMPLF